MLSARVFRDWHRCAAASARQRRDAEARAEHRRPVRRPRWRQIPSRALPRVAAADVAKRVRSSRRGVRGDRSTYLERPRDSDVRREASRRGAWNVDPEVARVGREASARGVRCTRAPAMHARSRCARRAAEPFRAWRAKPRRRRDFAKRRFAAAARRTRRRTPGDVSRVARPRAVSVARAFATLRSLAKVENAAGLHASGAFRTWRRGFRGGFLAVLRGVDGAGGASLARDLTSRRLRRVTRTWYAIARAVSRTRSGAGRTTSPSPRIAAARPSSRAAKAFAAFRVAVVASAVTAVAADATRVKCAAVVGWRARRVRREVFWDWLERRRAPVRAPPPSPEISDRVGSRALARWRRVGDGGGGGEARRRRARGDANAERTTRRAASSRDVASRSPRAATADRSGGSSRSIRGKTPERAGSRAGVTRVDSVRARARTARRVLNERALMSAARLRARIERRVTFRVLEARVGGYEGVTTARGGRRRFRRPALSSDAFQRDGDVAVASRRSTEARQFAADLARRAGVQCVRAWRKHCARQVREIASLRASVRRGGDEANGRGASPVANRRR